TAILDRTTSGPFPGLAAGWTEGRAGPATGAPRDSGSARRRLVIRGEVARARSDLRLPQVRSLQPDLHLAPCAVRTGVRRDVSQAVAGRDFTLDFLVDAIQLLQARGEVGSAAGRVGHA